MIWQDSNSINHHTGTEEKVLRWWDRQEKQHLHSNTSVREQKARSVLTAFWAHCSLSSVQKQAAAADMEPFLISFFSPSPQRYLLQQPMDYMLTRFQINNLLALSETINTAIRTYWVQKLQYTTAHRANIVWILHKEYCSWAFPSLKTPAVPQCPFTSEGA